MRHHDPRHGRTRRTRVRAASPEIIAAIVAMSAGGFKQQAIAEELGVSQAHVSKVLSPSARAKRKPRVDI